MFTTDTDLPVADVLGELKAILTQHDEAILQAPPGAGKTTLIPLALASEPWLGHQKILILEPRRIATRAAAQRMSDLLGEPVGQTVGYRMRLDTKVSAYTKIEVITEGILTNMLQDDPSLENVGLVIFDEFHERSLDADLALALCLKGRAMFREAAPLKLLVMSATLDSEKLAGLLNAPIVQSQGKQYPVDVIYGKPYLPKDRIDDRVVTTILQALNDNPDSNLLVFLPGQGEIRRVSDALGAKLGSANQQHTEIHALYGNLSLQAQQAAIAPVANPDKRKVVLATNIAETSLTIEGVDVVIDAGLAREPSFDPSTGMTRLQTRRISQASATQRAGRAGRLRPGKCYRLWSKSQQDGLAAHTTPEILGADLTPMALQLLKWGVNDPAELQWLDQPGSGPWQQAIALLTDLGAIKTGASGPALNHHGSQMAELATHPRLAHMLICGAQRGASDTACLLASLLSDRDPLSADSPDIAERLDVLQGQKTCPAKHRGWFTRTHQLAEQFARQLSRREAGREQQVPRDQLPAYLIACAYPDRIARRRHAGGYQLANGRGAALTGKHPISHSRWLAVAEVGGMAKSTGDTIRSAAPLDPALFDDLLSQRVIIHELVAWDKKTNRFIAERRRQIGELILETKKLTTVPPAAKQTALVAYLKKNGLEVLPFNAEIRQWQARVELVRTTTGDSAWPNVSDPYLTDTLDEWLGPFLEPVNLLTDFRKLDLKQILSTRLTWDQTRQLDQLVPERLKAPSGASHRIDYTQTPPVLAVKLQEMFGCEETPRVLNNRVALLIHLLSPAGRPLQVTQDLAGFWRSSYQDVKKDMKGRYPKHPWPDNPLTAAPTARTKNRSEKK